MKTINDMITDAVEGREITSKDETKPDTGTTQPDIGTTQPDTSENQPDVGEAQPAVEVDPLHDIADLWDSTGETPAESAAPELSEEEQMLKEAMELETAPDPKDDKAGKKWGAMKSKLKEYEKRLAEVEQEPVKLAEQLAEERKAREELERQYEKVSLQDSPKFRQEYDEPIKQTLGRAARVLAQNAGVEPKAAQQLIDKAIRMPFADRNRFLMDEAPELQGVLSTLLLQADEKLELRQKALQDWQATREALNETELRSSQVQSVQTVNDALSRVVPELAAEGNPFYRKIDGSSTDALSRNQAVDLRVNAVKQVLLKQDPAEIARYVADGFVGRETREALIKYRDEVKRLRNELKDVAAQRPDVRNRSGGGTAEGGLQGSSVEELVQSAFGR